MRIIHPIIKCKLNLSWRDLMADDKPKGHVEFRQPLVKLVADIPGDDILREHLDEMIQNDGYPGSCSVINTEKQDT
jgi:hypothetical protein